MVATGNVRLFPELKIPVSTARTWIARGSRRVVSAEHHNADDLHALRRENAALRAKAERYLAIASLLLVVMRLSRRLGGVSLDATRVPEGAEKARLLRAIRAASRHAPLRRLLRLIGLSSSRYHAWHRRSLACRLEDHASCPRSRPSALTATEVKAIRTYVLDPALRHMSVRGLSLHAQRTGRVFASPSTWHRLIRAHAWRRPRSRVYPTRPAIGVRATRPNEWWHIDVTVIRLTSGARAYLHAVIDNFSRKVLAWELAERVAGKTTTAVLERASRFLGDADVRLMSDAGTENVNGVVDDFLEGRAIKRVLAQVEVAESNSMIEAFWRSLPHQWLYLHELDSMDTLRSLVDFYVTQHNTVMPHAAFNGATPDEVFSGTAGPLDARLAHARDQARQQRLQHNRSRSCGACTPAKLRSDHEGVAVAS